MTDITSEPAEDEIVGFEVSDETLEAAACAENAGVYTQMGLCTVSFCSG